MMKEKSEQVRASTNKKYEITQEDLPLCCPMPNMRLWDAHPRVYLPIHETGHEICPYCGAEYFMKDVKTAKSE